MKHTKENEITDKNIRYSFISIILIGIIYLYNIIIFKDIIGNYEKHISKINPIINYISKPLIKIEEIKQKLYYNDNKDEYIEKLEQENIEYKNIIDYNEYTKSNKKELSNINNTLINKTLFNKYTAQIVTIVPNSDHYLIKALILDDSFEPDFANKNAIIIDKNNNIIGKINKNMKNIITIIPITHHNFSIIGKKSPDDPNYYILSGNNDYEKLSFVYTEKNILDKLQEGDVLFSSNIKNLFIPSFKIGEIYKDENQIKKVKIDVNIKIGDYIQVISYKEDIYNNILTK